MKKRTFFIFFDTSHKHIVKPKLPAKTFSLQIKIRRMCWPPLNCAGGAKLQRTRPVPPCSQGWGEVRAQRLEMWMLQCCYVVSPCQRALGKKKEERRRVLISAMQRDAEQLLVCLAARERRGASVFAKLQTSHSERLLLLSPCVLSSTGKRSVFFFIGDRICIAVTLLNLKFPTRSWSGATNRR